MPFRNFSMSEPGILRSRSPLTFSPSSSSRSTPSAHAIRSSVPNVLIRTGMAHPSTRSKRRAWFCAVGPFTARSAISVISSSRFTGALMRRSWPLFSSSAMNSRRSWKLIASPCSAGGAGLARGAAQPSRPPRIERRRRETRRPRRTTDPFAIGPRPTRSRPVANG